MKLYYSVTSPFARKVLVHAHEIGLGDAITVVPVALGPTTPDAALSAKNPLGKIPTLELDDGTPLFDSRVICEYLESRASGPRLVPAGGPERLRVLRLQALADGALDAGILVRYETAVRPAERRWDAWIAGQLGKVAGALDLLEHEAASFGAELDLGQIATACALGWLDFRRPFDAHPQGPVDMRAGRPTLFAWYERFKQRPSMVATEPR